MVRRLTDERGDSLILVALSLLVLLALLALAIDVGFAYSERRHMQNAADAGALAGAAVMMKGGTDAEIRAAVDEYVRRNTAQSFEAHYTINNSPVGVVGGGSVPNNATGIQVRAIVDFPTFLAYLVGTSQIEAHGDAIGGFGPLDIMLVMDRSGSMDDDSCSWQPYPPLNGVNCNFPIDETRCTRCYVCIPGQNCNLTSGRQYGVWSTPPEPITAAKNAAKLFVDQNNPNLSHIGLASYASGGTLNRQLTSNFASVKTAIDGLVANGCTDAPAGIRFGRNELTSARARPDALRFIVFLTDGLPNMDNGSTPTGCSGCPDHCPPAKEATRREARAAANSHIYIYTIALGNKADQELMQDVADITGGEFFFAPDPADLPGIYLTIFERIQLRLTQ